MAFFFRYFLQSKTAVNRTEVTKTNLFVLIGVCLSSEAFSFLTLKKEMKDVCVSGNFKNCATGCFALKAIESKFASFSLFPFSSFSIFNR